MSESSNSPCNLVGLDKRGARHQLGRRLSNISRCLIGMEACSGTHFIARQLMALGHDVRLIPAQYVKPFLKGHKNDYRDAEAVAEGDPIVRLLRRCQGMMYLTDSNAGLNILQFEGT